MKKADAMTVASLLREYAQRSVTARRQSLPREGLPARGRQSGALSQPLGRIIAAGALTEIPGIGDAIADIVTKLYETGTHPSLEKLRKEVPDGVLELFAIPGLRPDKILKLHQELGISSLAELEAAAKEDRIRPVKGLGASLQTKILQNLAIARSGETQLHLHKAAALLEHAVADRQAASTRNIRASKSPVTFGGAASWFPISRSSRRSKKATKPKAKPQACRHRQEAFRRVPSHATGSADHLEQLQSICS